VTASNNINRAAEAAGSVGGEGPGGVVSNITSSTFDTETDVFDISKVDAAVLEAASPHLTGNAAADRDIVRFFEARAKLLHKVGK
jgi:kinesin family protein 6/9